MLEYLEPVMREPRRPETGLAGFVQALAATSAEVAPAAETQAQLFVSLDTTFSALAEVAPFDPGDDLGIAADARRGHPRAAGVRPFLAHSATLFTELQPGVEALAGTAPVLTSALQNGTPVLRDSPSSTAQLARPPSR